jgi:hypothetical protein
MSATSPTISTAPPPLTTRIARSTPCVCGYDLQGLAADGRCPECARKIDGMLVASRLMPAVAQWRRRVAFAGGVIAVSGGLWVLAASFVLVASGSPEQIFFALLGPHVCSTALVARELAGSARASIVVITAMLGAACFGMGLWMLTRTPRELPRSRARMALAGLLRLSIIFALAITVNVVPAELVRGPTFISSFFWTASYQWTGVADAAELIVAGMYLASIARTAGRRGLAWRLLALFTAAGASVVLLGPLLVARNNGYGLSWRWWKWYLLPADLIVFAAFSTATWLLLVRFAGMSLWNRTRWWAWAGFDHDPDADRPAA